jgi:hypothetical protein
MSFRPSLSKDIVGAIRAISLRSLEKTPAFGMTPPLFFQFHINTIKKSAYQRLCPRHMNAERQCREEVGREGYAT